jgi:peptidoglycan hydrolase CwlO-like protein
MDWIYIIENWVKICAVLLSLATVSVSPFLIIRIIRRKNKLIEAQTEVKINRTFREELDLMNSKIDELTDEVRNLGKELHKKDLALISLKSENDMLEKENERLRREIDESTGSTER